MLVDLTHVLEHNPESEIPERILRVLSASIRDTDVIGWHRRNAALGIIFTEIAHNTRQSVRSTLLLRITGLLYESLDFERFGEVSIASHMFPEEWFHDVPHRPSAPVLYPDLIQHDKSSRVFSVVKRAMDVSISAVALLLCAPLFCAIGAIIKLSSDGPVLFRQIRVGQHGTPFVFLKFRSMYADSECEVHKNFVAALISGRSENGPEVFKLINDLRVTRIGAFLRKTSLDELPQLYNVLKGEMSLVGPRPAIPYEVEAYAPWHRRRVLEAKPGMTGLWQVTGRSRVTFDDMVRLDVRYAMSRSLWLDLKILMKTPLAVLGGTGAR
jgi:lipopolysaccharide/colanic/teichoic acid biosynthesis glycosyltransferase